MKTGAEDKGISCWFVSESSVKSSRHLGLDPKYDKTWQLGRWLSKSWWIAVFDFKKTECF